MGNMDIIPSNLGQSKGMAYKMTWTEATVPLDRAKNMQMQEIFDGVYKDCRNITLDITVH